MAKIPTHGGPREGAGRTPKDPSAGPRLSATFKLHPDTLAKLREHATAERSQAEIIDQAVAQWSSRRNQ